MYELWDHEGVRGHKIGELQGWSVEESQSSPETRLHCSAPFCGIFVCYTGRGVLPDSLCPTDSLKKTLMLGKIEGRRDKRGWDGWMASPTLWTWVWTSSRSWWWTGKPGVLQSMGSQRVGHGWITELNWTSPMSITKAPKIYQSAELAWGGYHSRQKCSDYDLKQCNSNADLSQMNTDV